MNKTQKLATIPESVVLANRHGSRTIKVVQPDAEDEFEIIISEKLKGFSIFVRPDQAKQLAEFINKHYRILTNDLP